MIVGLIASGQFVRGSLAAEFGDIPPTFLPLGNKRLYVRQIECLSQYTDRIFMSLPVDFSVPEHDLLLLDELGVQIIRTNPSLTLGEAISLCANIIGEYQARLIILYGDTIIENSVLLPDSYTMHATADHQAWAPAPIGSEPQETADGRMVISGFFSFSDIPVLLRSISLENGDFVRALLAYSRQTNFRPIADGEWYDFGHIQTYYQSCGLITTQRSFNRVSISTDIVEKFSNDPSKMDAEATWFEAIPEPLRRFTPAYLGRIVEPGKLGYRTANAYLATLSNLAVFGSLDVYAWKQIFDACDRFLIEAGRFRATSEEVVAADYYQRKTEARLRRLGGSSPHPIDEPLSYEGKATPSMLDMARLAGQVIADHEAPPACIIHGDFCFSNIFYDFRSRSIKVIDPRGELPTGGKSIFGDPRYDVAKLAHSVVGFYDMIVAGRVKAVCAVGQLSLDTSALSDPRWVQISAAYERSAVCQRYPAQLIHAILVQLFLSMLPLHADNPARQVAFLANAARLFLALEQ